MNMSWVTKLLLSKNRLARPALAVLRAYGTNAHAYVPGIGVVSGLTAGNYLLSDGSTGPSAVDSPDGLVLDAAGSVGSELTTAASSWSPGTGVSVNTSTATVTYNGAETTYNTLQIAAVATAGNWYQCSFVVSGYTAGGLGFGTGAVPTAFATTNGAFTMMLQATASSAVAIVDNGAAGARFTGVVSNISVKQVTGIHATQPTAGSRPTLRRGLYNLLTYSQDFTNAAWAKNATATAPSATVGNMPAVGDYFYEVITTYPTGTLLSIGVMLSGSGTVRFDYFNTVDGGGGIGQDITLTATPTLYVSNITTVAATGTSYVRIGRVGGYTATSMTFGGAFLVKGTITAAQAIAQGGIPLTTAAAASNPGAGSFWLDTATQFLTLGSVPVQETDDFFICVGAACSNKSIFPPVYYANGSTAVMQLYFDNAGIVAFQYVNDAATTTFVVGPAFSDGVPLVISHYKQSGQCVTGVNATDGTPIAAPTGAFTMTAAKLASGISGVSGVSIVIKGTVSAADRLTIKRFVASLTPNCASF